MTELSVDQFIHPIKRFRLSAIKGIKQISSKLGKEKTRTDLVKFLENIIEDEEDDNIIELAEELTNFVNYVGGKQYFSTILKLYEKMLNLEDSRVKYEVFALILDLSSIKEVFADL